ncbi:hypothetical protein QAD02_000611 [Eretmocerus hayati]|uniref:Uncharacterized protein n=1 Tax=Eretmocerus hayati TaxID=131215 RepID=A0ACC2NE27_9HYME|nr:hypothetical protein QAD02_000611 [Eretmocerus hayati]
MDHSGPIDCSSSEHSSRASPMPPMSPRSHHQQHQHPRSSSSPQQPSHRNSQQQREPGSPQRASPAIQGMALSPPPPPPPPSSQHQPHPPPHPGQPHLGGGVPGAGGMVARMPGLPPPGLGLLGQLGGMLGAHHGSPLELMAAHHAVMPPRNYSSPPPISSSDPTANECKLVDYRGQKVAAFIISGDTMLCLPQAFELFLKHLVGGLHTVYTKLKRLDIVPLVCNVEQVRILRGLGAIQPGVNRCKLLSCKDFDVLYRDCTTAR